MLTSHRCIKLYRHSGTMKLSFTQRLQHKNDSVFIPLYCIIDVVIVCVLQLYACVVLVIHLCNHVITSDYISIPCGLVIALYCIYEYCLVTVVPCRVQGPSFITNWRRGLTGRMTSTAGGEGEPPAAPAAAAVSAGPLGLYGVVATFDPNQDDWCEYIERLEHYFSANDIASPAKRRAILLTAVGASTYRLIRTLVFTDSSVRGIVRRHRRPSEGTFQPETIAHSEAFRIQHPTPEGERIDRSLRSGTLQARGVL